MCQLGRRCLNSDKLNEANRAAQQGEPNTTALPAVEVVRVLVLDAESASAPAAIEMVSESPVCELLVPLEYSAVTAQLFSTKKGLD
mgnify:CR=1 FL=1